MKFIVQITLFLFCSNTVFGQEDLAFSDLDQAFLNEIKLENSALSERIEQLPSSAKQINSRISAALKNKDDNQALELALELEKMLPDNADVKNFIGKLYSKSGNHQKAQDFFDSALRIDSKNKWFYIYKATSLASLGKMDDALTTTDQLIALFPNWSIGYNLKASLLHRMNQQSESLKTYELALATEPKSALIYCNRGDLFLELSKESEAIDDYKKALMIQPDYDRAKHKIQLVKQADIRSKQN